MTDYLGPLSFGPASAAGTYTLKEWVSDGASASIALTVSATSADTLAAAIEVLAAQLRIGNTYAHHEPGTTNPVVYRVIGVSGFSQVGAGTWHAFEQRVSFTLSLSGAPQGALSALYTAQHVDSPASLSLAALLGTNPTSLDVAIYDDSGGDMHSVMAAIAPTAVSDAKWLVLVNALTWTSLTAGTGATWWGNVMGYTTSASNQIAVLDTSQYPTGKYRLWARVQQSAGIGYVMDSQNAVAVPVNRATPHLVCVGDLDLPTQDTTLGTVAPLTLSAKSDGVNVLSINAFVLMPLSWGYFSWHPTTVTREIDHIEVGPTGIWQNGASDATYFLGGPLVPTVLAAHCGTLVPTPSPTLATWPTDWGRTASSVTRDRLWFPLLLGSDTEVEEIGAVDGKFSMVATGAAHTHDIYWLLTVAGMPLVTPGTWLELLFTRQVTTWASGSATVHLHWFDVDGNSVLWQTLTLGTVAAADAAPVAVELHAKVPVHASRVRVYFRTSSGSEMAVYYSGVILRRCPMRMIVVAEEASGTLVNYSHPVHVTVKSTPKYEVARG